MERDEAPEDWRYLGNKEMYKEKTEKYVYKFRVEKSQCRFEDVGEFNVDLVKPTQVAECENCTFQETKEDKICNISRNDAGDIDALEWHGIRYKIGDCILMDSEGMEDPLWKNREKPPSPSYFKKFDESIHTELYRKPLPLKPKGYIDEKTAPLRVGRIVSFHRKKGRLDDSQVTAKLWLFDRVDEVEDNDKSKIHVNGLYWNEDTWNVRTIG